MSFESFSSFSSASQLIEISESFYFMTSTTAYTLSRSTKSVAVFSLSRINQSINDKNKSAMPEMKKKAVYIRAS
jgi:hypothetical protein